jgi:hypothetical protein
MLKFGFFKFCQFGGSLLSLLGKSDPYKTISPKSLLDLSSTQIQKEIFFRIALAELLAI